MQYKRTVKCSVTIQRKIVFRGDRQEIRTISECVLADRFQIFPEMQGDQARSFKGRFADRLQRRGEQNTLQRGAALEGGNAYFLQSCGERNALQLYAAVENPVTQLREPVADGDGAQRRILKHLVANRSYARRDLDAFQRGFPESIVPDLRKPAGQDHFADRCAEKGARSDDFDGIRHFERAFAADGKENERAHIGGVQNAVLYRKEIAFPLYAEIAEQDSVNIHALRILAQLQPFDLHAGAV